jgi:hypothetical protein
MRQAEVASLFGDDPRPGVMGLMQVKCFSPVSFEGFSIRREVAQVNDITLAQLCQTDLQTALAIFLPQPFSARVWFHNFSVGVSLNRIRSLRFSPITVCALFLCPGTVCGQSPKPELFSLCDYGTRCPLVLPANCISLSFQTSGSEVIATLITTAFANSR